MGVVVRQRLVPADTIRSCNRRSTQEAGGSQDTSHSRRSFHRYRQLLGRRVPSGRFTWRRQCLSRVASTYWPLARNLPSLIALGRHKRNALAIFSLNLFLGWTLIGWVLAIVWSLSIDAPSPYPTPHA
ncbi:MAG: superinfection immunity protein [Caulobacteraceae bacterium]